MTTPVLVPIASAFGTVRFYTAADPYFYTIDNRPLGDLASNDTISATAIDAARRAAMIDQVMAGPRKEAQVGQTMYVEGLLVTSPSSNNVAIGSGSAFQYTAITTADSRNLLKQYVNPVPQTFAINTVTISGAQSVIYLIEGKFADFDATTLNTFPAYDNTNTYLPQALVNGNLLLQIKGGVAATTGSEVAPSVDSGFFGLYYITVNGATPTVYTKVQYATTTSFNSWGLAPAFFTATNQTSTGGTVGDLTTNNFADAATQLAFVSVPLITNSIVSIHNPYKPIKLRLQFSPTVSANNFSVQIKYQYLSASASALASYTTLTLDVISAGTADQLQVVNLTNGTVPALNLSTLVNSERLNIIVQRVGADAGDTNTGVLRLVGVQVYQ